MGKNDSNDPTNLRPIDNARIPEGAFCWPAAVYAYQYQRYFWLGLTTRCGFDDLILRSCFSLLMAGLETLAWIAERRKKVRYLLGDGEWPDTTAVILN